MKRIEVFIPAENLKKVVDAISKIQVGGITVGKCLGRGTGERPWIGGTKGQQIDFNAIDSVVTVVNDSQVEEMVSAILSVAHTGAKGDGKIFVTNVEEAIDIATKEKGSKAL